MKSRLAKIATLAISAFCLTCHSGLAQGSGVCPLVVAGDFPVSFIDGRIPVIRLKVAGVTLNMMVDSGAGISSLTNRSWQALGGPPFGTLRGYATGFGGNVQFNTGIVEDVDTGHAVTKNQGFLVMDAAVPARNGRPLADGVLGYDFLDNFDVGFDLPDQRITLYFYQHCGQAQAPWAGEFDQEPLRTQAEGLDETIPYEIDGEEMQGLIDSGAYDTMVTQKALDRAGVKPVAVVNFIGTGIGIGALKFTYQIARFDSIAIGAEQFGNAPLRVGNIQSNSLADVVVGEDYLWTHRVFISQSTQTALLGLTAGEQNPP